MTDDPISERDGPTLEEMHQSLDTWRASLRGSPRPCYHWTHVACTHPTRRQIEVFVGYLMAGGEKQAAYDLGITYQTLKNHMSELYARLGTDNAAQTAYVLAAGYLMEEGA